MKICLNTDSFEIAQSGRVVGEIWVDINGELFPEAGWSDFPVRLLTWWADAILDLASGKFWSAKCLFMDGPFSIIIRRPTSNGEILDVSLIETGSNNREKILGSANMELKPFVKTLRDSIEQAIVASRKAKLTDDEIPELEKRLQRLNKTLVA